MPTSHRRGFLRTAALATGAALASGLPSRAIEPIGRTRPSHLKLSLAAYSYRDALVGAKGKPPTMDLFGFADLAADMGLDAIEPTSYYFPTPIDPRYLNRLRQHAFRLGLDISGTAIRNDFCLPAGPRRDLELNHVREWVDHAVEIGAPVIRIFAGTKGKGQTEDEAVALAIEGIRASLPYAIQRGVSLALENHGGITARPDQLLRLVRAIDSPQFGVNLDTGNFHGPDPYADLAQLAPYAINVQVKTEVNTEGNPKVEADLPRLVSILKDARYSGYVALEYEAAADPIRSIPGHIKALRSLLA